MIEIEIKIDGRKVTQQYVPVSELNLSEAIKRNGWSYTKIANKLGVTSGAVHQMISGSPNISTIYKIAWAMGIDPRDMFFRMSPDGQIIEEPKVNVQELLDEIERLKQGPLFSQPPQNAEQVLLCPNCGTTFLVTNIPRLEKKKDTE